MIKFKIYQYNNDGKIGKSFRVEKTLLTRISFPDQFGYVYLEHEGFGRYVNKRTCSASLQTYLKDTMFIQDRYVGDELFEIFKYKKRNISYKLYR